MLQQFWKEAYSVLAMRLADRRSAHRCSETDEHSVELIIYDREFTAESTSSLVQREMATAIADSLAGDSFARGGCPAELTCLLGTRKLWSTT